MKQDNVYHDYDLVLEMVGIDNSDRHAQINTNLLARSQKTENAISNIQLFITKQRVYFWQMSDFWMCLFNESSLQHQLLPN